MYLSQVIKRCGESCTKSDVARWAGVTPQAVNRWTHVPPRFAAAVEVGSGGRVTVEEMAPGLRWYRDERGRPVGYLAEVGALPVPPAPALEAEPGPAAAAGD